MLEEKTKFYQTLTESIDLMLVYPFETLKFLTLVAEFGLIHIIFSKQILAKITFDD